MDSNPLVNSISWYANTTKVVSVFELDNPKPRIVYGDEYKKNSNRPSCIANKVSETVFTFTLDLTLFYPTEQFANCLFKCEVDYLSLGQNSTNTSFIGLKST